MGRGKGKRGGGDVENMTNKNLKNDINKDYSVINTDFMTNFDWWRFLDILRALNEDSSL